MVATSSPVPLAVEMAGGARQIVDSPWGAEQRELPSLPARVRQDYFVQPL